MVYIFIQSIPFAPTLIACPEKNNSRMPGVSTAKSFMKERKRKGKEEIGNQDKRREKEEDRKRSGRRNRRKLVTEKERTRDAREG